MLVSGVASERSLNFPETSSNSFAWPCTFLLIVALNPRALSLSADPVPMRDADMEDCEGELRIDVTTPLKAEVRLDDSF
jgi:hypothetical protein